MVEVTGRRGRRHKQMLDILKERRGHWKLKEEAVDRPSFENSLGKRLWTCRKTGNAMNECYSTNSFWKKNILKKAEPELKF